LKVLLLGLFSLATLIQSTLALACDELVGRLIASAVRPSIESLGCSALGKAGLDNAEHRLDSVCYVSSGPESTVSMMINLKCKTSDAAFVKAQVSENVSASARVRASDCQIVDVRLEAAGEVGKILIQAFNGEGAARKSLQGLLDKFCARQ
jgi:hypothetical protein